MLGANRGNRRGEGPAEDAHPSGMSALCVTAPGRGAGRPLN